MKKFKRFLYFFTACFVGLSFILAATCLPAYYDFSAINDSHVFIGLSLLFTLVLAIITTKSKFGTRPNGRNNPLLEDEFRLAKSWEKFFELFRKQLKPSFFQKLTGRGDFPFHIKPQNFI